MAISRAQGSKGLYANIHAKRKRIKNQKAAGQTPERMRSVGSKGAPTGGAFKQAKKTAKKVAEGGIIKSSNKSNMGLYGRKQEGNMPQGKGTYGKKKGRPPKKMMGGGMAGIKMPKMMSRGGKVVQAERKAMGGAMSVGSEVAKKIK